MAITTIDGIIAGLLAPIPVFKVGTAGEAIALHHSHFYSTGVPGAAIAPSPGLAGTALTSYLGQIPWTNPSSGNSYIARFSFSASVAAGLWLMDRLWHNSGFTLTTTTAQTVNSVTLPARDRNGTTNGENILAGIEVSTTTGNLAAIANTTLQYTNSSGTAGRTGTITSFPAAAVIGTFIPFQLQAGDIGIRSIQSLTLGTSYVSGVIHLVMYRPLIQLGLTIANIPFNLGAIGSGMVRCYDDTVGFLVQLLTATTATVFNGQIVITQG